MMRIGDDIAHNIALLRNGINTFLMARLTEEGVVGLAPSHGAVLVALYEGGAQPMKAVCDRVNRDKSTLTVLARKLESLGYIRREADKNDSRVTILCLTEKGIAFRALFERISEELRRTVWGDASEREKEAFCRQLSEMTKRIELAASGARAGADTP
ncbi:MarR family winged helix-turn-helix transcriptional regulator [Fretibacterium sp. OH1220_COT-178]|uniref:MarR family winged helix-turn-helix transcriptional regulator n=1 Tax=Fretibacterium sp. OH1220_COT-178 TaxID=2491047 RepID=UPI000F5EC201|nr:MarR family transcriptional regulator [Fretibacterium sp. OH1220_COT-178]RRD63895.1 MarR family transcriptional regulator [Fretibacterium sp. OH1220_COT-178]